MMMVVQACGSEVVLHGSVKNSRYRLDVAISGDKSATFDDNLGGKIERHSRQR